MIGQLQTMAPNLSCALRECPMYTVSMTFFSTTGMFNTPSCNRISHWYVEKFYEIMLFVLGLLWEGTMELKASWWTWLIGWLLFWVEQISPLSHSCSRCPCLACPSTIRQCIIDYTWGPTDSTFLLVNCISFLSLACCQLLNYISCAVLVIILRCTLVLSMVFSEAIPVWVGPPNFHAEFWNWLLCKAQLQTSGACW